MLIKKVSVIAAITASMVMSASAAINIIYTGADGFIRSNDTDGLLAPGGSGNTALIQLIFTTVNGYGGAGIGGTLLGASEQLLDEQLLIEGTNSDEFGALNGTSFGDTFAAGFIYVRIFDQGTGLGGAGVVNGTWYYNSPLYATVDNLTPETPDQINVNGANTSPTYGFGDTLNLQVPEPSVLAFFGIGGLALAIRRRIKA